MPDFQTSRRDQASGERKPDLTQCPGKDDNQRLPGQAEGEPKIVLGRALLITQGLIKAWTGSRDEAWRAG